LIKKQHNNVILIFFISMGFLISFFILTSNLQNTKLNNEDSELNIHPEVAAIPTPLPYSAIYQNDTNIYRLFESINFTIDTSSYNGANYTIMQVFFTNGSLTNYSMSSVSNNEFHYEFKPKYDAPIGFQNVSFLIYNASDILLNTHTTYTNFTIKTNYMANFDQTEYFYGDTLYAELALHNFSSYIFQWNITVVDNVSESSQTNLLNLENNLFQFSLEINNDTFEELNKIYYIKLNISDRITGTKGAAYFPFRIGNLVPIINSTIKFNPEDVFRSEECEISLNVSDSETNPEDLLVTMYIHDSEGELVLEVPIDHVSDNLFLDTFTIPWHRPVGKYNVNITVTDENGGSTSKKTILIVKNNLPEIHSYQINGKSKDQRISIAYGKNIVFTFNVSDTEGVAYIKIALLNENNEWYNITKAYDGIYTEITIRTVELLTGNWFVYLYVTDSDGAVVGLTDDYSFAPQGIVILADLLGAYLPWISLFIGLSIGVLIGVGGIYKYSKSKFSSSQGTRPKKKPKPTKESPKKQKKKDKQIKEEIEKDKKESKEIVPGKDVEKDLSPTRKIKRKL